MGRDRKGYGERMRTVVIVLIMVSSVACFSPADGGQYILRKDRYIVIEGVTGVQGTRDARRALNEGKLHLIHGFYGQWDVPLTDAHGRIRGLSEMAGPGSACYRFLWKPVEPDLAIFAGWLAWTPARQARQVLDAVAATPPSGVSAYVLHVSSMEYAAAYNTVIMEHLLRYPEKLVLFRRNREVGNARNRRGGGEPDPVYPLSGCVTEPEDMEGYAVLSSMEQIQVSERESGGEENAVALEFEPRDYLELLYSLVEPVYPEIPPECVCDAPFVIDGIGSSASEE